MKIENIKFLKYGSRLSYKDNLYQFLGECQSQKNYLVINLKTNEQTILNIADFSFVKLVDKIRYITSDYQLRRMLEPFSPYYLYDVKNNQLLDIIELVMYGSDEYHFIITKSSNKYVYTRTYHICEFAEELERKGWVLLEPDEALSILNNK